MRWLALFLCASALVGCELVADFDRSKLTQPAPDAGNAAGAGGVGGSVVPMLDASTPDTSIPDANVPSDEDGG